MAELEIRITSRNLSKTAFDDLERQAKNARGELEQLQRAGNIDAKVDMDATEVDVARRDLEDIDNTVATPEIELEAVDLRDFAGQFKDQLTGLLGGGGPIAAIFGTAAVTFGDDFVSGFMNGFESRQNEISVGIRTGLDQAEVRVAGELAGELYTAGFGENLGEIKFQVAAVSKELQDFDLGASDLQINRELQLLSDQFGIELPQSIEIAQRAVSTGLAPTVTDALDDVYLLASELPLTFQEGLDVLQEYAPTVGGLNLEMGDFVAYLIDVQRSGQFENLSQGAEALREFNTRLMETDTLDDVISELKLDSDALRDAWSSGDAATAIELVNDALQEMDDKTRANEIAAILFGTAVEDNSNRLAAVNAIYEGLNSELGTQNQLLDDATDLYEENQSGLQELQRDVESFAAGAGAAYGEYYSTVSNATESFVSDLVGKNELGAKSFGQVEKSMAGARSEAERGVSSFGGVAVAVDGASSSFAGLRTETANASSRLSTLNAQLDGLDGKTVNTYLNNIVNYYRGVGSSSNPVQPRGGPRAHGGVVGAAQSGGVRNGLTLVGEEGPEYVDLPPGSMVYSNPDSQRMAQASGGFGGGGGPGLSVTVNVAGSVMSERDLVGVVRDELVRGGLLDAFTSGAVSTL